MENVRSMLQQIDRSSKDQAERSEQVVSAASAVRKVAEENAAISSELDKVVENLAEQADVLEKQIGSFKS